MYPQTIVMFPGLLQWPGSASCGQPRGAGASQWPHSLTHSLNMVVEVECRALSAPS